MRSFFLFSSLFFLHIVYAQSVKFPHTKHSFIVIAHRGEHTAAPENTLQAIENAINYGIDYVEIDLRTTRDSQLVIMHDASLDRMTGVRAMIKDISFDSIARIKVIDPLHPEWGNFKIPNFKEVLELCKGKINIYLDFKDASVEAALQLIRASKMEKNIIVYINSPQQFFEWRKLDPAMPMMISLPANTRTMEDFNRIVKKISPDILDGNFDEYSIQMVNEANKLNIPIWADIQNSDNEKSWMKAIDLGIRGLQTDRPRALIQFLERIEKRN